MKKASFKDMLGLFDELWSHPKSISDVVVDWRKTLKENEWTDEEFDEKLDDILTKFAKANEKIKKEKAA